MEKFFKLKQGSEESNQYFNNQESDAKAMDAWEIVKEKFEIKTDNFAIVNYGLAIEPSDSDFSRIGSMLLERPLIASGVRFRQFRSKSDVGKEWKKLTKFKVYIRPNVLQWFGVKSKFASYELFEVDGIVYGSVRDVLRFSFPSTDDVVEIEEEEFRTVESQYLLNHPELSEDLVDSVVVDKIDGETITEQVVIDCK